MAEYIDKAEAIRALTSSADYIADALERLDNIPPADVQPVVHGRWVYDENGLDWNLPAWCCSECHAINANIPPFIKTKTGVQKVNPYLFVGSNFCPNCGANMKGKTDG